MAVWSEVQLSEIPPDFRLDSSYYDPDILLMRSAIENSDQTVATLESISSSIVNFGAYSLCNDIEFQQQGISFITAENIMDGFIDYSSARCIPLHQHENLLWKSRVYRNQVLVAMAARLGYAAVYDGTTPLNSSQDVAKITLKDVSVTDPYYVAAFINSKLGRQQLLASQTGSVQQHTNLGKIKALTIVIASQDVQRRVSVIYKKALDSLRKSQRLYAEAEDLLLSDLGLSDLDMSLTLFYESHFSEASEAWRMDAEFFQPKYYRILESIHSTGHDVSGLGNLILPIRSGLDAREFIEEGTPYVRVGDIRAGRIDLENAKRVSVNPTEIGKDIKLSPGNILFTRKGSFGNSAVVRAGQENAIISSEIMLLRITNKSESLPEYVSTYLNSPLGFQQVERYVHGVAFYSITQKDLASLQVIVAPYELQKKIQQLIQESHRCFDESKRLIESAKRMVEEAILENETRK